MRFQIGVGIGALGIGEPFDGSHGEQARRLHADAGAGKNSTRLYIGPKGARFVPIFGKSGNFWG